jgi:ArsR family metal-binding transcriptional regulator
MDCSGSTKQSTENYNNNNNNIVIETHELIITLGTDGKIILYWSLKK